MTCFLALDAGSSFLKAAVVDASGLHIERSERVPFPDALPHSGRHEVDPKAVLSAVDRLIESLRPDECQGVVLCGQMHGIVLVDHAGRAVSNYISWLDQRVSPAEFAELGRLVPEHLRAEAGNEFRPGIGIAFLYWLRERGELPAGSAPVSIADFIACHLTGAAPVLDPTQAAAFGLFDLARGTWHREIVRRCGFSDLTWPAIGSLVGHWRSKPCWASVGDQQATLAGALLAQKELSVNIGTGSQVSQVTDSADAHGLQLRPYFDGGYLRTVTHIPGGRALSALAVLVNELAQLDESALWDTIGNAVEATPVTDVRASVAFYPGPCGDRGFFENLCEANLRVGHLFRAAFEAMAENHAQCAHRLGESPSSVVFSGGVARRSRLLRELIAERVGKPARLSPHQEDSLFGLTVLARALSLMEPSVRAATAAACKSLGL